jgi:hypothetical protein
MKQKHGIYHVALFCEPPKLQSFYSRCLQDEQYVYIRVQSEDYTTNEINLVPVVNLEQKVNRAKSCEI